MIARLSRGLLLPSLLALVSCRGAGAQQRPDEATRSGPEPLPVGTTQVDFEDMARQRPLRTRIWYPADPRVESKPGAIGWIFVTRAVPEAAMASSPRKLPLILLSHGTGGSTSSLAWIAELLAAHGHLVAAVEHFGNAYGNATPEGAMALWRRPPDLSRALDQLLASRRFGARIDAHRIGAAGMSAGGFTVIELAGGTYHPERMGPYCAERPAQKGCQLGRGFDFTRIPDRGAASRSYRDDRFRAVFALAPALGPAFAAEDLAKINVPVGIVASAKDEWVPLADNAAHFAKHIPGAPLTVLPKGSHFTFLSSCNDQGRESAQEICVETDPTVDREALHDQTGKVMLEFFDKSLR